MTSCHCMGFMYNIIMKTQFPPKLVEAVHYLNQIQIVLCTLNTDGRRNSQDDEDIIIKLLQDKFGEENIIDGEDRYWWDVKIFGYYVNIKTSDFTKKASDNISSFAGILYAFTQIPADEINKHPKSQQFLNAMQGTRDVDNNRDYYLLVVDKSTTKVYLNSVKALAKITANRNNLPFQINWSKNTVPVQRTHSEAHDFVVQCIKKGIKAQRAKWEGYEDKL